MGGLAVYCAFATAVIVLLPVGGPVVGVLLGGAAAVIVGLVDEFRNLPPLVHAGGQIIAAAVAIGTGVHVVTRISLPFATLTTPGMTIPGVLGLAFTLVWLVGMMNTVNFLDGLDGLASGVAGISALLLAAWAWEAQHRFYLPLTGHDEALILPLALAGALLGFLPFNWHRASIFLGDSGSMFLGLTLGALSIVGPAKLGTALLILLIPVLDVAWAIVRRQVRGRSFLSGDKQHVYHRMLELGFGHTATVLFFYAACVALGVLDLVLYKGQKFLAFLALGIALGSLFVGLELRAVRDKRRLAIKEDGTERAIEEPV